MLSRWWIVPLLFSRNVASQVADDDLISFVTVRQELLLRFDTGNQKKKRS